MEFVELISSDRVDVDEVVDDGGAVELDVGDVAVDEMLPFVVAFVGLGNRGILFTVVRYFRGNTTC